MEEPKHAILGPSSADRWWACPGSVELIAQAPKQRSSEYAAQGTVAHTVAEHLLRGALTEDYTDCHWIVPGAVVEEEGFKIEIDEEMLEHVDSYVDLIMGMVREYKIPNYYVMVEKRVYIPHTGNKVFGTADTLMVIPYDRVIVVDLKYGAGHKVDVRDNKQLLTYGVGAYYAIPEDLREEISTVELIIFQPRIGGDAVTRFELPVETLKNFHQELIKAVDRVQPGAEVNAGSHCRWCPAKIFCPAHKSMLEDVLQADFANLELPALTRKEMPKVQSLTPGQVERILDLKKDVLSFFEDVETFAYNETLAGRPIPNRKVVKKDTKRAFKDIGETCSKVGSILWQHVNSLHPEGYPILRLNEEHDVALRDVLYKPQAVRTPNQVEEGLKKLGIKKDVIKDLWHNPDKGTTLVHISDKRPSVEQSAQTDFAGLDVASLVEVE